MLMSYEAVPMIMTNQQVVKYLLTYIVYDEKKTFRAIGHNNSVLES